MLAKETPVQEMSQVEFKKRVQYVVEELLLENPGMLLA